jgi:Na+/glutamate symporter
MPWGSHSLLRDSNKNKKLGPERLEKARVSTLVQPLNSPEKREETKNNNKTTGDKEKQDATKMDKKNTLSTFDRKEIILLTQKYVRNCLRSRAKFYEPTFLQQVVSGLLIENYLYYR